MAKKPKSKMPRSERAKQFMPFAALSGFEDALKEKETEHQIMMEELYVGGTEDFEETSPEPVPEDFADTSPEPVTEDFAETCPEPLPEDFSGADMEPSPDDQDSP